MKTEIILLLKYFISIYLLSIIFFTVVQKIHNRLYYSRKNKYNRCSKEGNASSHQNLKINKINKYKYSSKNKHKKLTKEERRRIKIKYNLAS